MAEQVHLWIMTVFRLIENIDDFLPLSTVSLPDDGIMSSIGVYLVLARKTQISMIKTTDRQDKPYFNQIIGTTLNNLSRA
mgnify:CR=1 FL=1